MIFFSLPLEKQSHLPWILNNLLRTPTSVYESLKVMESREEGRRSAEREREQEGRDLRSGGGGGGEERRRGERVCVEYKTHAPAVRFASKSTK